MLRANSRHGATGWALVLSVALISGACTSGDSSDEAEESLPSVADTVVPTSETTVASTTAALPMDFGVDPENAVITLGVIMPSDASMAGHRAYWSSVNRDLGGVGGRFAVELQQVASLEEAAAADVAAVSLDGSVLTGTAVDFLAVAPAQTIEAVAAGRTLDVTRPSLGAMVAAAADVAADPAQGGDGTLGVATGSSCPFDPMTYQLTEGPDATFVLVCGTPEEVPSLVEGIAGIPILTAEAWSPDLTSKLPEPAYVLGAVADPTGETPGADVLAASIPATPWDPAFVRGYTAALTTHLALERALDARDLTRMGIRVAAEAMTDADVGFGPPGTVSLSIPDESAASGLRNVSFLPVG